MPYYVTSRIMESLNNLGRSLSGARVLVLGVAYKKDVADTRESPSLKIIQLLRRNGAEVLYNDPYVPEVNIGGDTLTSVALSDECLASADCVVIATNHSDYDYQYIMAGSKLVFDTRGVTKGLAAGNTIRL